MAATAAGIFISHTHVDQEVAHAIRDAVQEVFGDAVPVRYSTNKEMDGGIAPGSDWFRWIGEQVAATRIALVLLTPASVQKPWVLWEAGAVAGATLARDGGERRLIPISYNLKSAEVPTPFERSQVTDGLKAEDVQRLFNDFLDVFGDGMQKTQFIRAAQKAGPAVESYLERAQEALRTGPMLVTEPAVQEWMERLDALARERRFGEADELRDWIDVAFGRTERDRARPLDLRLHRRLGDLYASGRNPLAAAREYELARRLSPRDMYVLRQLGKAYLDARDFVSAEETISAMAALDATAFERNAENAALKARWRKDLGDAPGAIAALRKGIERNPGSHYLANLAAEYLLDAGQREAAVEAFGQVLRILDATRERSLWSSATAMNAALALGDPHRLASSIAALREAKPTPEQAETILRGAERVAMGLGRPEAELVEIRKSLRGGDHP